MTLYASDMPYWRAYSDTAWVKNVTASGQSTTVTNDGNKVGFPRIRVKPTQAKANAAGYKYMRWMPVYNPSSQSFSNFPFDICNAAFATDALVAASKMLATGDDLRVFVDGAEANRWLDGINTGNTKVWVNLNLSPGVNLTIVAAQDDSTAYTSIVFNEDITLLPSKGIFCIWTGADYEAYTYTAKNNVTKTVTGVTRAVKGTAKIAHSAGDTARWIEHEIWIKYGLASAAAPVADDTRKPMFELDHSTNTSWVYENFKDKANKRTARWKPVVNGGAHGRGDYYTANRNTVADPASEIGLRMKRKPATGQWSVGCPAGITAWNFTNGEKYAAAHLAIWDATLDSSTDGENWTEEYAIPAPTAATTWQAWSDNRAALAIGTAYFIRMANAQTSAGAHLVEAADCTLTLLAAGVPIGAIGAETGIYELNCDIANTTTGESIHFGPYTMPLNTSVDIDCYNWEAYLVDDNSNLYPYLAQDNNDRARWLTLAQGDNTIVYTETDATGVTMTFYTRDINTD